MDEQIAQFVSITGANSDRARFFVESAAGDVQQAVSTFYESEGGGGGEGGAATDSAVAATPEPEYTGPRTLSGAPAEPMPQGWGSTAPSTGRGARSSDAGFSSGGGRSGGGIATLSDLRSDSGPSRSGGGARIGRIHNPDDDGDDEDDDDEDGRRGPANLFTGGGRSALSVQNPDFRRDAENRPDIVRDILRQAAEAGARGPEPASSGAGAGDARAARSFGGRGRTLGDDASESAPSNDAAAPSPAAAGLGSMPGSLGAFGGGARPGSFGPGRGFGEDDDDEEGTEETAVRHLTFWQDGFSVEDGPLLRYDDPANSETLAAINSGRAPLSLLNVRFGQPVELRVADRKSEKYVPPPKAPMKPFEGSGQRLGSPAPALASAGAASSSSTAAAPPAASAPPSSSAAGAPPHFEVDSSQPTTQIQIRLGDGSRLVGKFNLSHTVADIRRYIDAAHPSTGGRAYTLQASFPPKPLTDESSSIDEAGLKGAVVIQKWS